MESKSPLGSCNPAPMGAILSSDNMPSAKFTIPKNTLQVNTPFTITMVVANFQTGVIMNREVNYFMAPQQLNGQGQIMGHLHAVVETLTSLDQTTLTDPKKFALFKGITAAATNGVLTADVTTGLPAGFYRLLSINTAANHQPMLVPIAQHGSLDDTVYMSKHIEFSTLLSYTNEFVMAVHHHPCCFSSCFSSCCCCLQYCKEHRSSTSVSPTFHFHYDNRLLDHGTS